MLFALLLVLLCIFGATMGQILMKSGVNQVGEIKSMGQLFNLDTLSRIFTNPRIIAGILCYGIALVLWLGAMSTLNVSFIYPLMSLAYVLTAIFALIYLKESITILHWIGIAFVVVGCFLIVRTGY
ncbi:MAG: EamA family transporter [Dehalococcoidia bacterium]|nr:EamA family transporter [Dehalococcoidia bacterium]